MQNKRMYLDRNIVVYLQNGSINLEEFIDEFKGYTFIYSDEHFKELSKTDNRSDYLSVLKKLKAQKIELILKDDSETTDRAKIYEYSCPYEKYEQYLDNENETGFDENIFAPIIARAHGADNYDDVLKVADKLMPGLESLLDDSKEFLGESTIQDIKEMVGNNAKTIAQYLEERPSLDNIRDDLGVRKGKAGNVSDANSIEEIWKLIEKHPDLPAGETCDQFFGFDPIDKQGYESWPLYLGISSCYSVLNAIGYKPDNGLTKQEKVSNIASDASHVAHAAFCDALMSADMKLCAKASVIYDYKNISTKIIRLRITKEG